MGQRRPQIHALTEELVLGINRLRADPLICERVPNGRTDVLEKFWFGTEANGPHQQSERVPWYRLVDGRWNRAVGLVEVFQSLHFQRVPYQLKLLGVEFIRSPDDARDIFESGNDSSGPSGTLRPRRGPEMDLPAFSSAPGSQESELLA